MTMVTHEVDGPLGRWTQLEWRPPHLQGWVDCVWYFDGSISVPRERVFPTGLLELIVQFDTPHREVAPHPTSRYPISCAAGLATGPVVIEAPPGRCRVLGIRLFPAGAYAILGLPLSAFADLTVDLTDLIGSDAVMMASECECAPTDEDRVRRAVQWLEQRLGRGQPADRAVVWVAGQIARTPRVTISELQEAAGISRSRLLALFRAQVGVTPKRFQRIHRFRRALRLLSNGPCSLSHLSLEAGYYDQPHFNAEFREMAGLTPTDFLTATRYPAGVNLPDPLD